MTGSPSPPPEVLLGGKGIVNLIENQTMSLTYIVNL